MANCQNNSIPADWATARALEIVADVQRFKFKEALELVAGRLRDAHRAGQLRGQETVREGR